MRRHSIEPSEHMDFQLPHCPNERINSTQDETMLDEEDTILRISRVEHPFVSAMSPRNVTQDGFDPSNDADFLRTSSSTDYQARSDNCPSNQRQNLLEWMQVYTHQDEAGRSKPSTSMILVLVAKRGSIDRCRHLKCRTESTC